MKNQQEVDDLKAARDLLIRFYVDAKSIAKAQGMIENACREVHPGDSPEMWANNDMILFGAWLALNRDKA